MYILPLLSLTNTGINMFQFNMFRCLIRLYCPVNMHVIMRGLFFFRTIQFLQLSWLKFLRSSFNCLITCQCSHCLLVCYSTLLCPGDRFPKHFQMILKLIMLTLGQYENLLSAIHIFLYAS